jgi:hypothetical protein
MTDRNWEELKSSLAHLQKQHLRDGERPRVKVFIPKAEEKTTRIPIRVVGGRVQFMYGGPLPGLRDGTLGDLIVSTQDIEDVPRWSWLVEERRVKIASAGNAIFFAVTRSGVPAALRGRVLNGDTIGLDREWSYVEVELLEELMLELRGYKKAVLAPCKCVIPLLDGKMADSLNEAYTKISQSFEPSRRAFGGNVFRRAFLGRYPLDEIRNDVEVDFELFTIFRTLWSSLVYCARRRLNEQSTVRSSSLEAEAVLVLKYLWAERARIVKTLTKSDEGIEFLVSLAPIFTESPIAGDAESAGVLDYLEEIRNRTSITSKELAVLYLGRLLSKLSARLNNSDGMSSPDNRFIINLVIPVVCEFLRTESAPPDSVTPAPPDSRMPPNSPPPYFLPIGFPNRSGAEVP